MSTTAIVAHHPPQAKKRHRHRKKTYVSCTICGKTIAGNANQLRRHITRIHTGLSHPRITPRGPTRKPATSNEKAVRPEDDGLLSQKTVDLAIKMLQSYPAKCRHRGGAYSQGPLSDKIYVAGLPNIFDRNGQLLWRYKWIRNGVELTRNYHPEPKPTSKSDAKPRRCLPSRSCTIRVAPPFENTRWAPSADEIAPIPIETNVFTIGKYTDWPRPKFWSFADWPTDPTWIPSGLPQCCFCTAAICNCISTHVSRVTPHAIQTESMGEGVQATIKYNKGDLMGEFVGEIAPLNFYQDGWAADLTRRDLEEEGEHAVCQIYVRWARNWPRRINHSCDSSTMFQCFPISGRWRIVVQARRDILPGEEITVDYGE